MSEKRETNISGIWICITLLVLAFSGEPDIIDAIVYRLMNVD